MAVTCWHILSHMFLCHLGRVDLFISVPHGVWNTLNCPGSALLSDCSIVCPNGPPSSTCVASGKQLWTNGIWAYQPKLSSISALQHCNLKVELDLSLCSPACGLLTWCVTIPNICRLIKVCHNSCWQVQPRIFILGIQVWCHPAWPWTVGARRQHRSEI